VFELIIIVFIIARFCRTLYNWAKVNNLFHMVNGWVYFWILDMEHWWNDD